MKAVNRILLSAFISLFSYSTVAQSTRVVGQLSHYKKQHAHDDIHVILNWNPAHPVGAEDSLQNYRKINPSSSTSYDQIVNENGNFEFKGLKAGWFDLTFYRIGEQDYYSVHTFLLKKGDILYLEIDYPRRFGEKSDKRCPLCKKRDEVVPIIYGLTSFASLKRSRKRKIQLGGLIYSISSPDWYCKRDQLYY